MACQWLLFRSRSGLARMCGQVKEYTILHSGQPLHTAGKRGMRNEGVAIALNAKDTAAWKEAGEFREAVSSRIVTARLLLAMEGLR